MTISDRIDECPDRAKHTDPPSYDYLAFHEWMEQMQATHRQKCCPGCGFWVIWEPIAANEEAQP